jgi:hypothetical protein
MDGWTIAADVATILTGLSVLATAATWLTSRYLAWQQEKARTSARNWHGFIMTNGINDWYVRLVDDPKTPTAVVPLEIVDRYGNPDPAMAYGLRTMVERDGMLARVPTEREFAFLKFLHKELGYGKGQMIR